MMINQEYSIAISETLDILNHMPKEEVDKISLNFMNFLEANSSSSYESKLNHNQRISEMKLNKKTRVLLAIIYRQFWCSAEEKKEFSQVLKQNEEKYQKEMAEKYNPNDLFKTKDKKNYIPGDQKEDINTSLEVIKKETFWDKIMKFFKRIFK